LLQVHEIFNNYLKDNYWSRTGVTKSSFDLNVAACRVLIDIIPGLEASVLMETDGLVKRLYTWAEKAEQPLQVQLLFNTRLKTPEFCFPK
jgi:HIV-1 Vpr-binding protein